MSHQQRHLIATRLGIMVFRDIDIFTGILPALIFNTADHDTPSHARRGRIIRGMRA